MSACPPAAAQQRTLRRDNQGENRTASPEMLLNKSTAVIGAVNRTGGLHDRADQHDARREIVSAIAECYRLAERVERGRSLDEVNLLGSRFGSSGTGVDIPCGRAGIITLSRFPMLRLLEAGRRWRRSI